MKIIHKNCDPVTAKDKSLPLDSYLVTYLNEDNVSYDVVKASSKVSIFDHYYDNYGKGSPIDIKWTDGTVNPKLWGSQKTKKKG